MPAQDLATLLGTSALSRELQDAAAELACRLEHGEFDDLDEMQMADLKALATMLARWSTRAQALEHGTAETDAALPARALAHAASFHRN